MMNPEIIAREITANGIPAKDQLVSIDSNGESFWGTVLALPVAKMEERMAAMECSTYGMLNGEEFLLKYRDQLNSPTVASGPVTPFCMAPPRKKKW
jgi:hypothetical protein